MLYDKQITPILIHINPCMLFWPEISDYLKIHDSHKI